MKLIGGSVTRTLFWCIVIWFGFLQAWSSRMNLVNDTVSYLDLGDYIFAGHWSMAVNGVWNPLYACLLGLTLHIFHPSAYWEYPAVHFLLFVIFLFTAACFDFFLREMILFRLEQQPDTAGVPDWPYRVTAYVLFLWSSFALIHVSETNPDMLVAASFYLACGFLIRIHRGGGQAATYAWMGLALGLGYLTKSAMFPISLMVLIVGFLDDIVSRRRLHGSIVGVLTFLALSMPFATALSMTRHKLTFGESGTYNVLVHVNHRPGNHWQGDEKDGEQLLHPTEQIFDVPATFKFDGGPGGSYPVWFDPSYWYEGATVHLQLRQSIAEFIANIKQLAKRMLFAFDGTLFTSLFLLFCISNRGWLILSDIAKFWFLLATSIATLGMYAAVHVEMRYVAPFLVVTTLALWFSVRLPPTPEARRLQSGAAILLVLMFISPIGPDRVSKDSSSFLDLLKPLGAEPNRNEEVVRGLQAMGLRRGDAIASLEYSNCAVQLSSCEGAATWARLGGFKIVAEVYYSQEDPATDANDFWRASPATQQLVLDALAHNGARVVVSRQKPAAVMQMWYPVGNTPYYARWLVGAPVLPPPGPPGPLAVCISNPRYFCDPSGNVVYLAGDHTWANFIDRGTIQPPPAFDYGSYMSFMRNNGFNWMRLWTKELVNSSEAQDNISPPPYKWRRTGPGTANDGGLKYDFAQLDQEYFDRMRSRIVHAGRNGIYVSIMLFNGADWTEPNPTDGNPFEGTNNVNNINCTGTCPTTASLISGPAWGYERQYVHKVIDTVHDLPNAMYEVSNESPAASTAWQERIIAEIGKYEKDAYGSHHPIGFTVQYPDGKDSTLLSSGADWISPVMNVTTPLEANGRKVIINDTDHSYGYVRMKMDGPAKAIAWAWENFVNGSGIAFMDPYLVMWAGRNNCEGAPVDRDQGVCRGLDPTWNPIRSAIRDVQIYAKKIDLKHMTPQGSLFSSGSGLASTSPPVSYLMVSPEASSQTIVTVPGIYTVEVFDILTHSVVSVISNVSVSSTYTFRSPGSDNYVVWIH
jgi:hypothetical protein